MGLDLQLRVCYHVTVTEWLVRRVPPDNQEMTIVYLYANGCSFAYGSELCDDRMTKVCVDSLYRWENSWPSILARLIGASGVYNDAMPSGSNERIVRTTVGFVVDRWLASGLPPSELLVVIGWTEMSRREFFVDKDFHQVVPRHNYRLQSLNRLVNVYRHVGMDDEDDRQRFRVHALGLGSLLEVRKIQYLFFDALSDNSSVLCNLPNGVQLFSDSRYLWADRRGKFMAQHLEEDRDNWTGRHPSELGHQRWANLIRQSIPRSDTNGPSRSDLRRARLPLIGGTGAQIRYDIKDSDQRKSVRLTGVRDHIVSWWSRIRDQDDRYLYP